MTSMQQAFRGGLDLVVLLGPKWQQVVQNHIIVVEMVLVGWMVPTQQ
jgi:hypothetical protein